MRIKDADIQQVLATAGFLVQGFLSRNYSTVHRRHPEGNIGMIQELTSYAPYIERLAKIGYDYIAAQGKATNGVFVYDVVAEAGVWFADSCMLDDLPTEEIFKGYLQGAIISFMVRGNALTYEQKQKLAHQLYQSA